MTKIILIYTPPPPPPSPVARKLKHRLSRQSNPNPHNQLNNSKPNP